MWIKSTISKNWKNKIQTIHKYFMYILHVHFGILHADSSI